MPTNDVVSVVDALTSGRINTLTELRRMERTLITAMQPRLHQLRESPPMELLASAWSSYVYSNNLLSELRNITRDYPFSSELLDEAKILAMEDPDRGRSWNFAWLTLSKIGEYKLIDKHAKATSKDPEMWGGRLPPEEMQILLQTNCHESWTAAVRTMLRHWEVEPLFPVP